MKLNKSYFMGLFMTFLMVGIAGIVAGVTIINTNPDNDLLHKGRLHSLYLSGGNDIGMKIGTGDSYLSILNGLIVGLDNEVIGNPKSVVIGGGHGNHIGSDNAGIAGGQGNNAYGDYSTIGGGSSNNVEGENSVVVGGFANDARYGAVIVGGENNSGWNYGVVLGGLNNSANGKNSLVMGSGAKGSEGSFVWNDGSAEYSTVPENSARIDVLNGVLIGTNQPVSGVRLVVNGAVKLGKGSSNTAGEVRIDNKGCIRASDGTTGHVLGKGSESECTTVTGCLFGSTLLQNGDKVIAYTERYSSDCSGSASLEIMCKGSKLCSSDGNCNGPYYPYCYKISDSDDREYSIKPKIGSRRDRITSQGGIGQEARVDPVEEDVVGQEVNFGTNPVAGGSSSIPHQ